MGLILNRIGDLELYYKHGDQTFFNISIHETIFSLIDAAYVKASTLFLGWKFLWLASLASS